jgi:hypothetical protein
MFSILMAGIGENSVLLPRERSADSTATNPFENDSAATLP